MRCWRGKTRRSRPMRRGMSGEILLEAAQELEWEEYREKSEDLIAALERSAKADEKRIKQLEIRSRAHSEASA